MHIFVTEINNNLNLNFMAVPKERVVARLKAFAGRANLSNTRIDEISARLCSLPADDADDAAIDAVITSADSMFPFKDIASQDDKIIGLENKLKVPGQKTKEELDAEAKAKSDAEALALAAGKSDTPEYIKTLMATIEGLKADIVEVKTGKVLETKRLSAAEAFGKSEILKALKEDVRPNWLNRINVESETPIEDQIKSLETEYTTMAQSFADSIGYSGPTPASGSSALKVDEKMVEDIVNQL